MPAVISHLPRLTIQMTSAAVLIVALTGCGRSNSADKMGPPPPPTVSVATVVARDVPIDFEYPGQSAGSREVEIRARVDGIIEKRLFEEGSVVKAGQPLFVIAPATYAAADAAAAANVATAEANVQKAQRDFDRYKPLIDARAVSQMEFDNIASALDVARANLKAAQAQYSSAHINLSYTDVRAPISGVIGRALKVEGALASASSDSLLATMAQVDPIDVYFSMSDADHDNLQSELASGSLVMPKNGKGFVVKLKTNDGKWLPQTGTLNFSDYKADVNTGAFTNRARFANSKGTLTPGQFLRVVLTGAVRPNAIAVPQRAVLSNAAGKFVYVVGKGKDGKPAAELRPVVPGEWVRISDAEPNDWVIKDGLLAGDQIIVDGSAHIFAPSQPINPQFAESQPAEPRPAQQAAATQH